MTSAGYAGWSCDGCACLEIEPPPTRYGYYLACCTDVDKPVAAPRQVVAAARVRPPFGIQAPVYCRGKKTKGGAADGVPAGRDEIL